MKQSLHIHNQPSRRLFCAAWMISIMMLISTGIRAQENPLTLTGQETNLYLYAEGGQWLYTYKMDSDKASFNGTITGTFTKTIHLKSTTGTVPPLTINALTVATDNWAPSLSVSADAAATINLTGTNKWDATNNNIAISNSGDITLNNKGDFHLSGNIQNEESAILTITNEEGDFYICSNSQNIDETLTGAITNLGTLNTPSIIDWRFFHVESSEATVQWTKQGLIPEAKSFTIPGNRSGFATIVEPNENYTFLIDSKTSISQQNSTFYTTPPNTHTYYLGMQKMEAGFSKWTWNLYGETAKISSTNNTDASTDVQIDTNGKTLTIYSLRGLAWIAAISNTPGSVIDGFAGYTLLLNNDLDGSKAERDNISISTFSYPWLPISYRMDCPFKGKFDGQGHTISKIAAMYGPKNITTDQKYYNGLFGQLEGAEIKDLTVGNTLSASTSEGITSAQIGGIAGYAKNSIIDNCHNKAIIQGFSNSNPISANQIWIGSIIGYADENTAITNCSNTATTTNSYFANDIYLGGIAGEIAQGASLSNCFTDGYGEITVRHSLSAQTDKNIYLGGIAGKNNGDISDSYTTHGVSALNNPVTMQSDNLGGITGINNGTIQRCYSLGGVYTSYTNKIANSSIAVGGIASANNGTISGCAYLHYDSYGSNFKISNGEGSIARISPLSTNGTLTNNYGNRHLSAKPDQVAADKTEGANAWSDINLPQLLGADAAWDYGDGTKFPKLKKKGTTGSYTEWIASTQPQKEKSKFLKLKDIVISSSGPYESKYEGCNITVKSGSYSPNKFYVNKGTNNASIAKLILEENAIVENEETLKITESIQITREIGKNWVTFSAPLSGTASVESGKTLYVATGYNTAAPSDQEWITVTPLEGAAEVSLEANKLYLLATADANTTVTFLLNGPFTFQPYKTSIELGDTNLKDNIYRFGANHSLARPSVQKAYLLTEGGYNAQHFYKQDNEDLWPFEAFLVAKPVSSDKISTAPLSNSSADKTAPPLPLLPFTLDYKADPAGGSLELRDSPYSFYDPLPNSGQYIYTGTKIYVSTSKNTGYEPATGFPKAYKATDNQITAPIKTEGNNTFFEMPAFPVNVMMRYDFIVDSKITYTSDTKDQSVVIKPNGVYTVSSEDASLLSLAIEPGGQVIASKPLKVSEDLTTTRSLNDKWSTFAAPVAMTVTVADDSKRLYTANGYLTTDKDAQKWISLSKTNGEVSASFTADIPYLIAAEDNNTEATLKATNVTIPADQKITLGEALQNGVFLFVGNSSLQKHTLSDIYLLNPDKNRFELKEGEITVEPMQAFVVANAVTRSMVRSLSFGNDLPTGVAHANAPLNDEVRIWGEQGMLHINLTNPTRIYVSNPAGRIVRQFQAPDGETLLTLPSGIYLIRCNHITYKIAL